MVTCSPCPHFTVPSAFGASSCLLLSHFIQHFSLPFVGATNFLIDKKNLAGDRWIVVPVSSKCNQLPQALGFFGANANLHGDGVFLFLLDMGKMG
jgi:hypothetical protein